MKCISINKNIRLKNISVVNIEETEISKELDIPSFDFIIISGGDGAVRRSIERLHALKIEEIPKVVINPAGTFNVLFHTINSKKLSKIIHKLQNEEEMVIKKQDYYSINQKDIFIFSAGNSLDVLYVTLSELFRISFLSKSKMRYFLSFLFLMPVILAALPLFLFSKNYYFIFMFTKLRINKFFNINFFLNGELKVDLKHANNLMQLDGDLIIIKDRFISIAKAGNIDIVVG